MLPLCRIRHCGLGNSYKMSKSGGLHATAIVLRMHRDRCRSRITFAGRSASLYLKPANLRLIKSIFDIEQERENMRTIILLTISNIFMTFAWYGHLKYRIIRSLESYSGELGIAFFEYCFQVPANRIGSYEFSAAQLKTIQEVITLSVFSVFSVFYLGEKIKWNYAAGFGCIALAVFFVFHKW